MTARVLVAEDEAPIRQRLIRLLRDIGDYEVVAEAANGQEAIQLCGEHQPAIVLMDINMPGMDGLTAARFLARLDTPPAVIFCTAYDQHAVAAFEAQAVGYLLKPVNRDKLAAALQRAERLTRLQMDAIAEEQGLPAARTHLVITRPHGIELLPVETIRCFRAEQKYVMALTPDGEFLLEDTLKDLEEELDERFYRVHRNCLVAIPYVEALEKTDGGDTRLRLNGIDWRPTVSRRQQAELKRRLREG